MARIWKFFSSVYLTVALAGLICIDAAWGSILSMKYPRFFRAFDQEVLLPLLSSFGPKYLYLTLWVYILIALTALFAVNTAVCTADKVYSIIRNKKPWQSFFPHIVHIGFLIALTGHLAGSVWGFRSSENIVFKGDTIAVPGSGGIYLRLDNSEMNISPSGELDSLKTRVTLLKEDKSEVMSGDIGINSPLIYKGIAFYHLDQGQSPSALKLVVDGSEATPPLEGSFSAPNGDSFSFGYLYPDFAINESGAAYSRSGEYANPHIEVRSEGRPSGYLDISAPGTRLSYMGHEIRFEGFINSEYVVFNINKDPGIGFIIAGSTVLVAGMVLLLFFRGERAELVRKGQPAAGAE